jgi:predicted pyridoxine 5'-phosphate oxidase superfamily flavin-nucleotide-binding protein
MAKQFPEINDRFRTFIAAQSMYFVATAARDGRVNLSPKGLDSLRVLGPHRVAWLNLTGSGNETSAHLLDNPRMTLMFCSFDREPMILRLYGTAREVAPGDADWDELYSQFPPHISSRQIYDLSVDIEPPQVFRRCYTG